MKSVRKLYYIVSSDELGPLLGNYFGTSTGCISNDLDCSFMYTVSQKNVPTYFLSVSVKYEPILIKIRRPALE